MQEKQQTENPPIQDYEELHTFMRREFGTEWRNILADKLKKANVTDLFSAPSMAKRLFIEQTLNTLENYSSQKKQVLRSELNRILLVQSAKTANFVTPRIKNKLLDLPIQQIRENLLNALLDRILKQEHRVETIYNAFWTKATCSLRESVDIKDIFDKLNNALRILKQDVDQLFAYYKKEMGISDDLFGFVKNSPQTSPHFSGFPEYEKRVQVAQLIYNTESMIDPWYDQFTFYFLSTLQQEIKKNEKHPILIKADDKREQELWQEIRTQFTLAHKKVNELIIWYRSNSY